MGVQEEGMGVEEEFVNPKYTTKEENNVKYHLK